MGIGAAPAYRGRGSVFIEGLQLGQSGQVPNLTFEVVVDGVLPTGAYNCEITEESNELVATYGGSNQYMLATLSAFVSTGKHQAETVFDNNGSDAQRVGICDSIFVPATGIGNDAHAYAYDVHYPCVMHGAGAARVRRACFRRVGDHNPMGCGRGDAGISGQWREHGDRVHRGVRFLCVHHRGQRDGGK